MDLADSDLSLLEVAYINAPAPHGARYDSNLTIDATDPDNYILVCPNQGDLLVFLAERGTDAFEERDRLRSGLSLYADRRLSGMLDVLTEKLGPHRNQLP